MHILKSIGQEHLLSKWPSLNKHQQQILLNSICALNTALFKQQQQLARSSTAAACLAIEPFRDYHRAGDQRLRHKGLARISQGKAGCIIVAGGQGTRLGWNGPKGSFPISVVQHKSLFQLFADKVRAAGIQAGRKLPLAVMTSPLNDKETRAFFRKHHFFGIDPQQVDFFMQGMLPFLNVQHNLFFESPGIIAQGPAGNGLSLKHFWEEGVGPKWKSMGVEEVNYIPIDNPLADPFDAELIGFHNENRHDISVKCTKKTDPNENVGILAKIDKQLRVVEYTELPEQEKIAMDEQGQCRHHCANLSLFCFQLDFIEKSCQQFEAMPLHRVKKPVHMLKQGPVEAWKFEFFIFDALLLAKKTGALLYPKESCFAPLKNKTGKDSIETVQAALQALDHKTFSEVSGLEISGSQPFELAQEFYYPTPALIAKWRGSPLPKSAYVCP